MNHVVRAFAHSALHIHIYVSMAGFTLAAIVGVFAGAALVPKVSTQQLRRGFSVFLVLVAVYILIRR